MPHIVRTSAVKKSVAASTALCALMNSAQVVPHRRLGTFELSYFMATSFLYYEKVTWHLPAEEPAT